jgi:hypothetical protein
VANTRSRGSRQTARGTAPLEDAASDASEAVRQAASVLEKELAAGVSGFQRLGAHLVKERRVDQAAFDDVLNRLRANAHEFVGVAANRVGDLRSEDVQELATEFSTHAQDLLDTVINMISVAPDLLNRVMAGSQRPNDDQPKAAARGRSTAPAAKSRSTTAKRPAKRSPVKKK